MATAMNLGQSTSGRWSRNLTTSAHSKAAIPVGRHALSRRKVVASFSTGDTDTYKRPANQMRMIQHKDEAYFFYMWLSQIYDYVVNPGHWTVDMREDALEPAKLDDPNLKVRAQRGVSTEAMCGRRSWCLRRQVVDVGGGTGFCSQGIVKHVLPTNVTLLDQSDHQLAKAKKKADLQGITIVQGDAEDLPFETDTFDRYVSAGSIEYWPEPQRGIREAYRVTKEGGIACMIGPVHPTFFLSRMIADAWMLFPTEQEYIDWYTKAGFVDVKLKRIGPKWYRGVRRHGLIMGCSVTGVKPKAGDSPLDMGPKAEVSGGKPNSNPFAFVLRSLLGTLAGSYYFLLPIYMWIKDKVWPRGLPGF